MTEELEAQLNATVKLVGPLPEHLQGAAFPLVFERVAGQGRPARPGRRSRGAGRLGRARSEGRGEVSPRGRPGPRAAAENLLAEGFFDEYRTVTAVRQEMEARGWSYGGNQLSTAVLRLLRDGVLQRQQGGEGWEYRATTTS
jgi:hypothetical protein